MSSIFVLFSTDAVSMKISFRWCVNYSNKSGIHEKTNSVISGCFCFSSAAGQKHTHTTCCSSCLVDLYPNFEVFFCLAYTTEQCTKRKKLFSVEHMHHQTPVPLVHALRLQVRTLFSSNTVKIVSS